MKIGNTMVSENQWKCLDEGTKQQGNCWSIKDIWEISLDRASCELDSLPETTYTELGENPCLLQ